MFWYVLRSFRRQSTRYWHIICILIFSMVIPLMLNILGSSVIYGNIQETQAITHNSDFRVVAAPQELVESFVSSGTFTASYIDGSIFLKIANPNYSVNQLYAYSEELHGILENAGMDHLLVYDLTKMQEIDPNTQGFAVQIKLITAVVILITIFIFQAGYQAHINNFISETKTLYTLGVSFKNIASFFLLSLTLEFILSFVCAVLISVGSMKGLFAYFLEVSTEGYSWLIYHVNWYNIVLLGGIWYVLLMLICLFHMHKLKRQLHCAAATHSYRRKKELAASGDLRAPYALIWTRCSGLVKYSIVLSVLVCSVAFFLLNYASINAEAIKTSFEASFLITKSVIVNGVVEGFTPEEIDSVNRIEGIEAAFASVSSTSTYLAAQPAQNAKNIIFSQDGLAYVSTNIKAVPSASPSVALSDPAYIPVWVNPNQPGIQYRIGDLIDLYVNKPLISADHHTEALVPALSSLMEKLQLQVVGFVNAEYMDGPLQLYFDEVNYPSFIRSLSPSRVEITINESGINPHAVKARLFDIFNGKAGYELIDLSEKEAISYRSGKGLYWMISLFTLCFLLLTAMVVVILLQEFMAQQNDSNHVLFLMGLSSTNLLRIYRRLGLSAFFIAAGASVLIGGILTGIVFANTGYAFSLTLQNFIIYSVIVLSLYVVMVLPMQQGLRKQLNKIE